MTTAHFLYPGDPVPDGAPRRRRLARWGAMLVVVLATAALAGGSMVAGQWDRGGTAQQPGPRRYPPEYWGCAPPGGTRCAMAKTASDVSLPR